MKPLLIGNASIETVWQWSLTYLVDMKINLNRAILDMTVHCWFI